MSYNFLLILLKVRMEISYKFNCYKWFWILYFYLQNYKVKTIKKKYSLCVTLCKINVFLLNAKIINKVLTYCDHLKKNT